MSEGVLRENKSSSRLFTSHPSLSGLEALVTRIIMTRTISGATKTAGKMRRTLGIEIGDAESNS